MKVIENNVINEIVIKKSKFIALLIKINNNEQINLELDKVKKEYKNASHYCYAFIIDNVMRYSDDGEPSGTAGNPILELLKKAELNYVLAIVIRYFGGIKLGSAGLIRAFSKATKDALKLTTISELIVAKEITITFSHDDIKRIEYILNKLEIKKKEYGEKITYTLLMPIDEVDNLINQLKTLNINVVVSNELFMTTLL